MTALSVQDQASPSAHRTGRPPFAAGRGDDRADVGRTTVSRCRGGGPRGRWPKGRPRGPGPDGPAVAQDGLWADPDGRTAASTALGPIPTDAPWSRRRTCVERQRHRAGSLGLRQAWPVRVITGLAEGL